MYRVECLTKGSWKPMIDKRKNVLVYFTTLAEAQSVAGVFKRFGMLIRIADEQGKPLENS